MAGTTFWLRIVHVVCMAVVFPLAACSAAPPPRTVAADFDSHAALEDQEHIDNHSNWMSRHKNKLKDLAINQVTLLGSHDADSKDVHKGSPPATGYLTHHNKHIHRHASAKDVGSARCQASSIAEQLKAGVRYFDMRVAYQDGAYFGMHMWLSTPFFGPGSVMDQIKVFMAAHPDEVLILYFQGIYSETGPMTDAEAAALFGLVADELPGLLLPKSDFSRLTFGEIWQGQGRVILMSDKATSLPFVWSDQALDSTWFDQQDPQELVSELDGVVASWRAGQSASKLRHLQAMTTTKTKIASARITNALVRDKLLGAWRDAPISVVQVDDAAHAEIMSILIHTLHEPK